MLHLAPPWSGYLEAGATVRGPFGGGVHTSRICCCRSGSHSLARAAAAALALARSRYCSALPLTRVPALILLSLALLMLVHGLLQLHELLLWL